MNSSNARNDFGPVALLRTRHFTVTTFGVLVGLGFFLSALHFWFYLGYRHIALHNANLMLFGLLVSLSAPLGAYSMARLLDLRRLLRGEMSLSGFFRVPGFALWGGLLLGTVTIYALSRLNGWNPLLIYDGVAFGLPLAQAIGRLGCLNYGCCHGRAHPHGHGICYTNPETKVLRFNPELAGVPLYPTQIYSAVGNLGIYLVLIAVALLPTNPIPGMISAVYLILYGTKRLLMELLRGEWPRTSIMGLTLWQWFSLGFVAAGGILIATIEPGLLLVTLPSVSDGVSLVRDCLPLSAILTLLITSIFAVQSRTIGIW